MQFIDICSKFIQTLLPQSCLLCGVGTGRHPLCAGCNADLPRSTSACCPVCALPSPQSETCGTCLQHPPAFDATVAAFSYAFPADALLRAFKYREQLQIAILVANNLVPALTTRPRPDLVIPMPLHPQRLRQRGFNQAAEIAVRIGCALDIPLATNAVIRVRHTDPQAGLPLDKRKRNIRGAFAATQDLSGKKVAIVDDVMTSGASLDELAKTIKAAGAASVECWIAARTPKD